MIWRLKSSHGSFGWSCFTKMTRQNKVSTAQGTEKVRMPFNNFTVIAFQALWSFGEGKERDLNSVSICVISVIVDVNNMTILFIMISSLFYSWCLCWMCNPRRRAQIDSHCWIWYCEEKKILASLEQSLVGEHFHFLQAVKKVVFEFENWQTCEILAWK